MGCIFSRGEEQQTGKQGQQQQKQQQQRNQRPPASGAGNVGRDASKSPQQNRITLEEATAEQKQQQQRNRRRPVSGAGNVTSNVGRNASKSPQQNRITLEEATAETGTSHSKARVLFLCVRGRELGFLYGLDRLYKQYRAEADKHAARRLQLFEDAKAARTAGQGAWAKELSEEVHLDPLLVPCACFLPYTCLSVRNVTGQGRGSFDGRGIDEGRTRDLLRKESKPAGRLYRLARAARQRSRNYNHRIDGHGPIERFDSAVLSCMCVDSCRAPALLLFFPFFCCFCLLLLLFFFLLLLLWLCVPACVCGMRIGRQESSDSQ